MPHFDSISAKRALQVKAGRARFHQRVAEIGLTEFAARQVALMNQAKALSRKQPRPENTEPTPDICTTDE